ncbi:1828_t:CDS:2, partial [Dentiscutata erythropus]
REEVNNLEQQISHCIKRYVHLGFDVTNGENIEKAMQNLKWTWPIEGYMQDLYAHTHYLVLERQITQIYKLLKSDIEQPQPEYSNHTISQGIWIMPDLRRWTTAKLHEELENLDIFVDKNTPRDELITVLKTNLCLKTLDNLENNNTSMENVVTENIDLMDIDKAPNIILFSLPLGWALRHNQKYEKKEKKDYQKTW